MAVRAPGRTKRTKYTCSVGSAEKKVPFNFTKSVDLDAKHKTQDARRKPVASDFFDEDSSEAEVETNTMDAPKPPAPSFLIQGHDIVMWPPGSRVK